MSATVPWNPVALWQRHRTATFVGFLPPAALLALLTLVRGTSLTDAIGAFLFCFGWGVVLARLIASRRWVSATLALIGLSVMAVLALAAYVDLADAPGSIGSHAPSGDLPFPTPSDQPTKPPGPAPSDKLRQLPPGDLAAFRRHSTQLVNGVVGFDYAPKMKVGDRTDVRLQVSVKNAVEGLRDSLTRPGRDPIVEPVKVSPRMKAELRGFGFDIKALSSVEQVVDADEDTTWLWDVLATQAGKQRITVTLTAVVDVGGSESARDVSTFYREVEVDAIPKPWWQTGFRFVEDYGPSRDVLWPAIPTVLAAVWALLFARRKSRQKRARRK